MIYIAIRGYIVSKLIRVVVILFWGIAGYSFCLKSEGFTTFSEEELDAPIDVGLEPFEAKEDHNEWYLPILPSLGYEDSEIGPFNGNIQNNRNIVNSYRQSVSPYKTRSKDATYRRSKYKKGSPMSQYKPVYVRGYYRRNGTYVRSHYRSRPSRRR